MARWAQWLIDRNLRYVVYLAAIFIVPFALIDYVAAEVAPNIFNMLRKDFR